MMVGGAQFNLQILNITDRSFNNMTYPDIDIIRSLETKIKALKLHKMLFINQRAQRYLSDENYHERHRRNNMAISRLCKELWKQKHRLPRQEMRRREKFQSWDQTPGAHLVYALLALYYDPNVRFKSSIAERTLRKTALLVYESAKGAPQGKPWCPYHMTTSTPPEYESSS